MMFAYYGLAINEVSGEYGGNLMSEQRIILVDSDSGWRKNLKSILTKLGYWVVGETGDGLNALKMVRTRQPELVILDAAIPGMDGFEVARIIHEDKLAPVIVLASAYSQAIIEKAKEAKVSALLTKPVDEISILPAIELALANYSEIVKLESKVKELKELLETRKLVEKAKGILMETMGLTESEAFRRMQKQSMNKRISMRQVAEAVILAQNLRGI
jgi:response regulator NasT